MKWIAALVAVLVFSPGAPWCRAQPAAATPLTLTLSSSDRVVFVGSGLVERDWQYGYFETLLHARFREAAFTFRNLGWSGDTVWGDARAEFGTQADGYRKLVDEVVAGQPTVLLINYGMNESFAGEKGLPAFVAQYNKLLEDVSKTNAKVWLIGPNVHEQLPPPLPDATEHNRSLRAYTEAVARIAAQRGCGFVDLVALVPDGTQLKPPAARTDDGIHFTERGSGAFALAMVRQLTGEVPPDDVKDPALDALRRRTIEKNRQFFYRWRPENDTYIFGFRKHEQGQNAVEIPKFDPIVEKLEREIADTSKSLPAK